MKFSVPATTANLGPGFDTLGLALDLYNHFEVTPATQDTQRFSPLSQASLVGVSQDPQDSLFFKTLDQFYSRIQQARPRVSVEITANIPLARGLGSSSSVIVAALRAGRALSQVAVSDADLLAMAVELEGHPDNVTPAFLGGVHLCDADRSYLLPWPDPWRITIWIPPYPLETRTARAVIPTHVSLQDAVFNLRKASLWVHALHTCNGEALQAALADRLHQPYRQVLIPEWAEIEALVKAHHGFGIALSGAGPSLAIYYRQDNPVLVEALQSWCRHSAHSAGVYTVLPLSVLSGL